MKTNLPYNINMFSHKLNILLYKFPYLTKQLILDHVQDKNLLKYYLPYSNQKLLSLSV